MNDGLYDRNELFDQRIGPNNANLRNPIIVASFARLMHPIDRATFLRYVGDAAEEARRLLVAAGVTDALDEHGSGEGYYLYEEQDGGCDHTIGCGRRLTKIEGVSTLAEAVAKVSGVDKHGYPVISTGEEGADRARVLAVVEECKVDVDALRADRERDEAARKAAKKEEAERKEFERLQKKFKGTS